MKQLLWKCFGFSIYSSLGSSVAFTSPCWPGRLVTRAGPSGVSMIVPLVMTPLRS